MLSLAKRIASCAKRELIQYRHHKWMKDLKGIIHVGANLAQERDEYAEYDLNVLWIEPIPEIFSQLKNTISAYPKQRAIQYLVLDQDDLPKTLHVADNDGASSSILDFELHKDVWPTISFVKDINFTSKKLDTIVEIEGIDLNDYDCLVLDTQGSELLVLQGADHVLRNVGLVKVEVADFESYAGCPRPDDIFNHLKIYGFLEQTRVAFAQHPNGGRYFDISYSRR
jgi:FkbM family methyltransferase